MSESAKSQQKSKPALRRFFFPEHGVTVEAEDYADALKQLEKLTKSQKEGDK